MGFISGIYSSATILIQSGVIFKQLSPVTKVGNAYRWTVLLADGHEWAIYITPSSGGSQPDITLDGSGNSITGPSGFSGLVQIAKLEVESDGTVYDASAGVYPVSASISATASGSYSLSWSKKGDTSKTLVMFALPHHIESFASDTASHATAVTLHALTKEKVIAVVADKWNLAETLPTS
jgi:endo-1,3(4)-beta-glucanase